VQNVQVHDVAAVATDPNWLLSSTAQSAAALVAIIGGFLVSRLISLSVERTATLQRHEELNGRRRLNRAQYDEVHANRLSTSKSWFWEHHRDRLVAECGEINAQDLTGLFIPRGSAEAEMRAFAQQLIEWTKAAYKEIAEAFPGKTSLPSSMHDLEASKIAIPGGALEVYWEVCKELMPGRRQGINIASRIPTSDLTLQRQDRLIEREAELEAECHALDYEITLVEQTLKSFKRPQGITGAIISLIYLALAGIALPTVLMALRPVPDGPAARTVIVISFISGLCVLLGYFIFTRRSLRPPD